MNILFVCVQNAGRSQMAQAFFGAAAAGRHAVRSAGTRPAERVHAEVVEAMAEAGLDVAGERPRRLEREDAGWADLVVTMGCGDECPVIPGTRYLDWELDDPGGKSGAEVRTIRDEIRRRVDGLLAELP